MQILLIIIVIANIIALITSNKSRDEDIKKLQEDVANLQSQILKDKDN